MPSYVIVNVIHTSTSHALCGVATGLVQQMCHRVVVLTVMLVSIDRCVAVRVPLHYSVVLTFRVTGWGLTFAWLESALVSCVHVFALRSHVTFHPAAVLCSPPPLPQEALWSGAAAEAKMAVVGPTCVIAVMFFLIVRSAHARRRIFALLPLAAVTGIPPTRTSIDYRKTTLRAMRTLFVVVGALAAFWAPDAAIEIYDYASGTPHTGRGAVVAAWATCASSGVNPLIFLSNRLIMERLRQMVGRGRGTNHSRAARCQHDTSQAQVPYTSTTGVTGTPSTPGGAPCGASAATVGALFRNLTLVHPSNALDVPAQTLP